MSAHVLPTTHADSLGLLRLRMIREVEIFLEARIARGGGDDFGRMIPTRPTGAAPHPAPPAPPAPAWASWYHGRLQRSSATAAAAAGENGPC